MRPTARGWVVLAGVVLAFAMAVAFGPRGLNAIVAPGVVALLAAVWQTVRFEPPALDREVPSRGERGSTVPVRLSFVTDTPRSARVVDAVGDGLDATGAERSLSLGTTTLEYDLHLTARGERQVGPTTLVVRDVLGLVQTRIRYADRSSILVRPRVHLLSGPRREALSALHGGSGEDRGAFDGLRQYTRGDPLRDVHWRSSAKRPDDELIVKQFAAEAGDRTVEVAAESSDDPGAPDAMAEAAASLAVSLFDAGVDVGLSTPSGRVEPDDPGGRDAILDHLARAGGGTLPARTREGAGVLVEATGAAAGVRVTVTIEDQSFDFPELAGTTLGGTGSARSVAAEVAR